MQQYKFKAIDLFSGCGGLTQGLKSAGFNVLAAVEVDRLASAVYSLNHKSTHVITKDIKDISKEEILTLCKIEPGELDLLAGCPPCQGFSTLRNKNKQCRLDDPRNRLIDEFARLVTGLLPKVVLLENVPRLTDYTRYNRFKSTLRKHGYLISDKVLDVQKYGVPQRRKRLVLIASRFGKIEHPEPRNKLTSVRKALSPSILAKIAPGDMLHDTTKIRSNKVMQIIRAIPKDGGSRSSLPQELVLDCHKKTNGFRDVYGRMRWDDPAPTITSGCTNPSKGRFLHPEEDRAITLREAALLQTFPARYNFNATNSQQAIAQMIGNALPPTFAKYQAAAIKEHLFQLAHTNLYG